MLLFNQITQFITEIIESYIGDYGCPFAGTVTMGLTSHGFVHNFVLMREDGKFKVCE